MIFEFFFPKISGDGLSFFKVRREYCTVHEDLRALAIKPSSQNLLRLRNVSDQSHKQNQNKFCVRKRFSENRAVREMMLEAYVGVLPSKTELNV